MVVFIMGSGIRERELGQEFISIKMEKNMRGNGLMGKDKELVGILGQVVICSLGILEKGIFWKGS